MRRGTAIGPLLALTTTCALVITPTPALATGPGSAPTKTPTAVGYGGAAATVDPLASAAAIDILKRGGNAVDAAVAAAAVLGVVEPFSCGIGGGGFMVIYRARDGKVTTIDHREKSPAAMRPDSFMSGGAPLAFNDARFSGLSVGVPGTVRGWSQALRGYGTMSLGQVLRPAIDVANRGFEVDQVFFDQIGAVTDYFDDVRSTRDLYLDPDGTPRDVGTRFRNPDLARTYALLGQFGPGAFYAGPIGDAIVRAAADPPLTPTANHVWRPGLIRPADLRGYDAVERRPTRISYRGLDVYGMGPPSSGGSTVGEALNILEGLPAGASREQALHYFLEASRYSFADRNAYLADPAFFDVPLRGLLSDGFAAQRRALITGTAATSPVAAGDPYPFQGSPAPGGPHAAVTEVRAGTTTHLTVSDKWGNVVSYTFTIESTGGAGIVVPGYGFLLNNELTDFNFDSLTHPNRADAAKRPRSSMSPTIVLRHGRPVLAVGSPGGSTIITTVLQILVDRYILGSSLPAAIAAPRLTQRNTAATTVEAEVLATPEAPLLAARGHTLTAGAEIGAATGLEFFAHGRVQAAAEPVRRGGGSAMVVRTRP